ncbi:MAG TPA: hypothetical protein VLG36_00755 [Candidatus Chromulinivoraceae bacterium]|nr:hypothetical protein [Candidatus Chromulinivoraceae bacterium]
MHAGVALTSSNPKKLRVYDAAAWAILHVAKARLENKVEADVIIWKVHPELLDGISPAAPHEQRKIG